MTAAVKAIDTATWLSRRRTPARITMPPMAEARSAAAEAPLTRAYVIMAASATAGARPGATRPKLRCTMRASSETFSPLITSKLMQTSVRLLAVWLTG